MIKWTPEREAANFPPIAEVEDLVEALVEIANFNIKVAYHCGIRPDVMIGAVGLIASMTEPHASDDLGWFDEQINLLLMLVNVDSCPDSCKRNLPFFRELQTAIDNAIDLGSTAADGE